MDTTTIALSKYIKDKGISILGISKKNKISIGKLYSSLSGSRALRADELVMICQVIEKDPFDFFTLNNQIKEEENETIKKEMEKTQKKSS